MVLTKEDIETAIAQTENQDAIKHSLSNYFEGLEEPAAVAIGIGESQWDRGMHPENVDAIVNLLREQGIDAVSFLDEQAARPDKFVVNASGVLCPFMSPEDSLKAAVMIEDVVMNGGYQIVGHINPQVEENLLFPASSSIKIKNDAAEVEQGIDLKLAHPDKVQFDEIERHNGGDYKGFIDRKINEAYAGAEVVDFDSMDKENVYENGIADLYRGGTLGANPYATVSEWNSRKVAHSSPAISICAGFSGKGRTLSSRGGGVYAKTQSGIEYGFIYQLESMGDEQQFYHNVGLETGDNARTKDEVDYMTDSPYNPWNGRTGQIYESPILPHHNKLKKMFIYVGQPGEQEKKLFSIPLDENGKIADREWRDFMTLHEPSDDKVLGYLKDRQEAQKREQAENPHHAYGFELKQGLEADTQDYLDNIGARDFLRNFIHDAEITEKDGSLNIDAVSDGSSLYLANLKLRTFPDLSNVKVNGHFSLNSRAISEVDATRLPECTGGINLLGESIKNVSALSADKFLKIIGAQEKDGYYDVDLSVNNTLSCDGMPQGWDEVKFVKLPPFVNLTYDMFEQIPETLEGISMAGVTVKDQSAIETMPAADFIHKIKGNLGTAQAGDGTTEYLRSQGVTHTQIHDNIDLHLEKTNIATMPAEMKELTVRAIVLNAEAKVTSLDNFSTTKEGIYSLNFEGDLKNETMESFLLKTKGQEWVEHNTSRAEDGHLIIDGDFDFRTRVWSERDNPQIKITSFPKDILDVEFKGEVKPSDLRWNLDKLTHIKKEKEAESLGISLVDIDLDLSQHQTKSLSLEDYGHSVVLPQTLETLSVYPSKDFDVSQIRQIPDTLQSLYLRDVSAIKPTDLSFMKDKEIIMTDSSFSAVKLPESMSSLKLDNVRTDEALKISKPENLTAKNMSFPQGSEIDLSESKQVRLENCSFPPGMVLDFSKCKRVDLENVDLSGVKVIPPQQGRVHIEENVKFAPDFKLDLSKCEEGSIHPSVQCDEVKLPQKLISKNLDDIQLPPSVKEITTSCLTSGHVGKIAVPPHVKIIDTPDKNGKKIPLKALKARGLSKEQIATLRKERIKNMFRLSQKAPKPATIEQDIAAMSCETGTAAFIYNDIHNSKVDNEFHYDYQKVIDGVSKAQKITPIEAEKKLLEYGILTPLPKGEYAINVENISNGVNFGGEVVFSYSKADVKTQYHEMAHSYQAKDGLFSDASLDKIYASESQKNNGSPADRKNYTEYLHEVHADAFACAASMLRSHTPLEAKATELDSRLYGENRTAGAYLAGLAQQDIKKYASQPVMKQLVREMQQIRAQGKQQEYFRADGTLDGSKVAKLCERVVINSAWTPSTYKSYMDNKIAKNDGWSKGVGKAILRMPLTMGASNLLNGNIFKRISKVYSRIKHDKLKKQEIKKLKAFVQQRVKIKDPQKLAVHEYERLQAQVRITASILRIGNANNFVADKLRAMQNMSDKELVETKNLFAKYGSAKAIKELQVAQNIIEQNKDNPYFQKIMENPANIAEMRQGNGKVAEKSKESPAQELSLTDKEKIAALSGRTGTKPNYAVKDTEAPTQTQTSEQVKSAAQEISQLAQSITPPQHQAVNTPQQQTNLAPQNAQTAPILSKQQDISVPSAEKVADMKGNKLYIFFKNLRNGVNTILAKAEAQFSPEKTVSQTKTQAHTPQQPNIAQMKMAKDRGKGII